jgi:hypothetical protein
MKQKQSASTQVYNQIICKVDTSRGAPMGRSTVGTKQDAEGKRIYCRRIYLSNGGAYWGCGAPLYVEYTLDGNYVNFFRKEV